MTSRKLVSKRGAAVAVDGGCQQDLDLGALWQVELGGVHGAGGVAGDGVVGALGGGVGQGVADDSVVAGGAQQDPDGGDVGVAAELSSTTAT